jgi:hypothetical protein
MKRQRRQIWDLRNNVIVEGQKGRNRHEAINSSMCTCVHMQMFTDIYVHAWEKIKIESVLKETYNYVLFFLHWCFKRVKLRRRVFELFCFVGDTYIHSSGAKYFLTRWDCDNEQDRSSLRASWGRLVSIKIACFIHNAKRNSVSCGHIMQIGGSTVHTVHWGQEKGELARRREENALGECVGSIGRNLAGKSLGRDLEVGSQREVKQRVKLGPDQLSRAF